ncbi:MAG: cupin domain-containing protein [Terriglobia bacterium]
MKYSRRDLSMLLPAALAGAAEAQEKKGDKQMPAQAWVYEDLTMTKNGLNEGRAVFDGQTHSGYPIELHLTKLAEGQMPHAAHHHPNEEVLTLRSGQLDANLGGKITHLTAGSVIYVASNLEHSWKNPGPGPAEYFVIALGNKKE